jgi:hypothetical protein
VIYIFVVIYNVLLATLLLRLRYSSEDYPLTKSQRWALTILAWLFMSNSLVIFTGNVLRMFGLFDPDSMIIFLSRQLGMLFNYVACLALLSFGLVYPRLVMKWSRLRYLLIALALLLIPFVIVYFHYDFPLIDAVSPEGSGSVFGWVYVICCFVPIFIWLPIYWKHYSPQLDNILTLLIWGYLFYFLSNENGGPLRQIYTDTFSLWGLTGLLLVVVVLIMLIKTIYHRRGILGSAEKLNIGIITIALSMAVVNGIVMPLVFEPTEYVGVRWYVILSFSLASSPYMIIRPTLFSYGLLRYQFFGPKVNAARRFVLFLAIMLSAVTALTIFHFIGEFNIIAGLFVGIVAGAILLFPFFKLGQMIISRALPMTEGSANAPLAERRSTYLMALQTAVVDGEIEDPYDREVLERLREDLKVSKREHDLLMDGFLRDRPQLMVEQLEEAYLFHKNGILLGYVSREAKTEDDKRGMMATMLTTVGRFSQDALKKGDSVESIEYGNITIIVEVEGEIALGLILSGKDNPQVRQGMRDVLRNINKHYSQPIREIITGGSFEEMKAAQQRLKGIEDILRKFLKAGGGG